jgi:hypothetical protein
MIDKVKIGGIIFLGDIKSLLYRDLFYRFTENYNDPLSVSDSKTERRKKLDFEHYIGAEFANKLENRFSRIKKVEIRVKKGKAVTEMNLFRFDMVIYLDSYKEKEYSVIKTPINSLEEFENILKNTSSELICIEHIRNKLFYENVLIKLGENSPCTASFYISDICDLLKKYAYQCTAVPCKNEIDEYFSIYGEKIK